MEAPGYRLGKPPGEKMLAIAARVATSRRVGEMPIPTSITASGLRF